MLIEDDRNLIGDEKTEAIDLSDIREIKEEADERAKTQEDKVVLKTKNKKKKKQKEKAEEIEETDEPVKVVITTFQAKRSLIKSILWGITVLLSIAFGVTAIIHGIKNFDNIHEAINNKDNWKATVRILSSLSSFLEAGLFTFFIFYSGIKSIFYFGPYRTWRKGQGPKKKKKSIFKK